MAELSNTILDFFSNMQDLRTKVITAIPVSADRLTPGTILVFSYRMPSRGTYPASNTQRVALIVRTKRGDGVFPGKTGQLVSCFRLNESSSVVVDLVLEELYNKRRKSNYYGKIVGSLKKLIGRDSFRTYSLNKMNSLYKFNLK